MTFCWRYQGPFQVWEFAVPRRVGLVQGPGLRRVYKKGTALHLTSGCNQIELDSDVSDHKKLIWTHRLEVKRRTWADRRFQVSSLLKDIGHVGMIPCPWLKDVATNIYLNLRLPSGPSGGRRCGSGSSNQLLANHSPPSYITPSRTIHGTSGAYLAHGLVWVFLLRKHACFCGFSFATWSVFCVFPQKRFLNPFQQSTLTWNMVQNHQARSI